MASLRKAVTGCVFAIAAAGSLCAHADAATSTVNSPVKAVETRAGVAAGAVVPLTFDHQAYEALRGMEQLTMTDFPLAPIRPGAASQRVELDLQRVDVFTADTRFVLGSVDGVDQLLARPDVQMFSGTVRGVAGSQVFLSFSPHGTNGYIRMDGHTQLLSSGPVGQGRQLLMFNLHAMPRGTIHWHDFICRTEAAAQPAAPMQREVDRGAIPCRQLRIAIESDSEFTDDLFDGSLAAAGAYVATLIGASSSIYTENINARFELGLVRLWNNNDPWGANTTGSQLVEFRDVWNATMGGETRHLAHFLSGRELGGGIAHLNAVCHSTLGYAVSANLNGFFPYPLQDNNAQNWDIMVVSHEFGHNFGSIHTHDFCPPLDQCPPAQYWGDCQDQQVCIPNGTIMSYCHLCEGGQENIVLEFHPVVRTAMLDFLDTVTECSMHCSELNPGFVEVIAADGDQVESLTFIDVLQPPFTNGLGQVGFTGRVTGNDWFVWFDDGIVWRNSFATENVLVLSTPTMGVSNAGNWMYNPQIDGNDGVYTNDGVLLKRGDPSPTEEDLYVTFTSRLQMLPDSTMYFISGLNPTQGSTSTIERIMYRVDPDGTFSKVFRSGDIVAGDIELRARTGVGFDYDISDSGQHHIHRLQAIGSGAIDFVYVDDTVAAYVGQEVGDDTVWSTFRAVSINNGGRYVFSGMTAGGPVENRNFLAADGDIAIRSGQPLGGMFLPDEAVIGAASINNENQVAFIWNWGTVDNPGGALFVGPVSNLAASETILAVGDDIDLTGDSVADVRLTRFNATTVTGPAIDFSDHEHVYLNVELLPLGGGEQYTAIIKVALGDVAPPTCPGDCGPNDGVVNVGDMLAMLSDWGQSGPCDLDGNGVINVGDMLILLSNWGTCP